MPTAVSLADLVLPLIRSRSRELWRYRESNDPRVAWETAHRLALSDGRLWAQLAKAYLPIDPTAAIRVQLHLVDASLEVADTRRYRPAARELSAIRASALAAGPETVAAVDDLLADLRERYRRRPSLLAALDRAKLP